MRHFILLALLGLTACSEQDDEGYVAPAPYVSVDDDNDGWFADEECDDDDAQVNPASAEVCDGIDNNCDGEIDEDVSTIWYADDDGDGHGDPRHSRMSCARPGGHVAFGTDCDDTDPDVRPQAKELCDGIDNNCDGVIDEDCSAGSTDDADWNDADWDDADWDDDADYDDAWLGDTGS